MSDEAVKITADSKDAAMDALFLACCLTQLLAQALPNQGLCHASASMTASLAHKLIYAASDWVETSGVPA